MMTRDVHEIASSMKANYPRPTRLTEVDSSITLSFVRTERRRIGPTSFYCNRLSPWLIWSHPTPNGWPYQVGHKISKDPASFAGRGNKTKRCDCARHSSRGTMNREFCASRGAATLCVGGGVSFGCAGPWMPGGMMVDRPTGRTLA